MKVIKKKTYSAKIKEVKREWYLLDVAGLVLGRVATRVANILRGKNKTMYTPNIDTGDNVAIVNIGLIRVTGNKAKQKIYFRHSDYPGGAKYPTFEEMMKKDPRKVMKEAVKGMLPKGPLGRQMIKKLKLFVGKDHNLGDKAFKEIKI